MSDAETPVLITQCQGCGGTIWRKGTQFQCPDCGGRSTEWGGFFPSIGPDGKPYGPVLEFAEAVEIEKVRRNSRGIG